MIGSFALALGQVANKPLVFLSIISRPAQSPFARAPFILITSLSHLSISIDPWRISLFPRRHWFLQYISYLLCRYASLYGLVPYSHGCIRRPLLDLLAPNLRRSERGLLGPEWRQRNRERRLVYLRKPDSGIDIVVLAFLNE